MSEELGLILTLCGGLSAALVFGYLAKRIGLSPIVGYLVAGIAVGPHTPGFVADNSLSGQSAELGIILLLFGVGLRFHLSDLLAVRKIALPGAIAQIALSAGLGAVATYSLGWQLSQGLVFGMAISVASTVVATRVLADNHAIHSPEGKITMGWLIVEDLFTVLVLVLLPLFAPSGGREFSLSSFAITSGIVILKLVLLFFVTLFVGKRLIPLVLGHVSKTGSRELFTLTILVIALGIALGSSLLFGASMALGAFLAGMVVGQSEYSTRAASEAIPMRDAFAVLFFVSVGMLFDPLALARFWPLALASFAIVAIATPFFAFIVAAALGRTASSALTIAASLSQIGEFSFILAALATKLGLVPAEAMNILVAVAVATIAINPAVFTAMSALARRSAGRRIEGRVEESESPDKSAHRVVLVGYGPVGQVLCRILRDNGIHVTVVEMNIETVRSLRASGIPTVYGDATRIETMLDAQVEKARSLIVSAPGLSGIEVTAMVRRLNPKIAVIFRAGFLGAMLGTEDSASTAVFYDEGEVALAMAAHLMRGLGSTEEQIDLERERVRKELLPGFGPGRPA
jgi:CPA2 family monovalent cation:H+ antiporter-2